MARSCAAGGRHRWRYRPDDRSTRTCQRCGDLAHRDERGKWWSQGQLWREIHALDEYRRRDGDGRIGTGQGERPGASEDHDQPASRRAPA